MNMFSKLGMVTALITSLFAGLADDNVGPATTPGFTRVASTAGELSATYHNGADVDEFIRILRMAKVELSIAHRLTELKQELAADPAFFAYVANLHPVLESANPRPMDVNSVLTLVYGLVSARSTLESDISTLSKWILIHRAINPDLRWVTPPPRFVSNSTEALFEPVDALTYDDLAPVLAG